MDKKIFFMILVSIGVLVQAGENQGDSIFDRLPENWKMRAACGGQPAYVECQEIAKDIQRCQDFWVQYCQSGKGIEHVNPQEVPYLYGHIYQLQQQIGEQFSQKEFEGIADLAVKPAVELINHNKRIKDIKGCQDLWQQYDQLCNEHNEINVQEEPSFAQPTHQSVLVQDDEQLTKEKEPFLGEDDIKKSDHRYVCAAVGTVVVLNICYRYFAGN